MWSRPEFEKAANAIGAAYCAAGGTTSVNDLSVKVATENGLDPDSIRTLVRLANVSTFEACFEQMKLAGAPDRDVLFDVGDAEKVISMLHASAAGQYATVKVASAYNRTVDWYSDHQAATADWLVKEAATEVAPINTKPVLSPGELSVLREKAASQLNEAKLQLDARWNLGIDKLAQEIRINVPAGNDWLDFEKLALASEAASDVLCELATLNTILHRSGMVTINMIGPALREKVAHIQTHVVASPTTIQRRILTQLSTSSKTRQAYVKVAAALKTLQTEMQ